MYRLSLILFFVLLVCFSTNGQGKINWLSWEEALEKNQIDRKKILVNVYTKWCGWCKKMEKSTLSVDFITEYINENYYAIRFDAEQKDEIIFNNKVYKFVGGGFGRRGYHELASEIMNGKLSYPTVVFIDENLNVIQPLPGYQNAQNFEMIMRFFAENHYLTDPWKKFVARFKSENFPRKILTPKEIQPPVQTVKN